MGALMVAEGENGAVLIVATDRDDRRYLFDALDAQEFDAIYTARTSARHAPSLPRIRRSTWSCSNSSARRKMRLPSARN